MSENQSLCVALYQMNSLVGDFAGNAQKILREARRVYAQGAALLVTPELALVGYPAEDWLLREVFCQEAQTALQKLAQQLFEHCPGLTVLVGSVCRSDSGRRHNAAALLTQGQVRCYYAKRHLPEYGVFDEPRVFAPGTEQTVVSVNGVRVGIVICEDLWYPQTAPALKQAGAELIVSLNASPFCLGKTDERGQIVGAHASQARLPLIYVNCVGGQDELVFDGHSFAAAASGDVCLRLAGFEEQSALCQWSAQTGLRALHPEQVSEPAEACRQLYQALVLATRDYVRKNGFSSVLLGLSGGVDSALVATIAVDALGPEHVFAVMMPTRFTVSDSLTQAKSLAQNLGIDYSVRAIEPLLDVYLSVLAEDFAGRPWDVTEENLQARIRGNLLMALSNKFSRLVLTTGNKSESAVGYCTLYGDTAGAFAPLRDVLKTQVWQLCRFCNQQAGYARIPEQIIERAPSAELREGQLDQQSLPDYALLDQIIELYVHKGMSREAIVNEGCDPAVVDRILGLIHQNEYKRRQMPVGPKVSTHAFGRDWRYPLTAKTVK